MFRNYFKTAVRSLIRHKSFSFINIAGLTLGLTAAMLIGLFVWDEHQYDKFIPEGRDVFRIYDRVTTDQGTEDLSVTAPVFAGILQREYPSVEKTTRVMMRAEYKQLFEGGGKQLYESSGFYVDSNYFQVFPLSFDFGTSTKALDNPSSIVLSREMANRFFGSQNPVGQRMLVDKEPVVVTGVLDINPKFHLQFNFLRPIACLHIPAERMQSWQWQQFFTYVKLKESANVTVLQTSFQKRIKEKLDPITKPQGATYVPMFQPLRDIYLRSASFKFDASRRGNIIYVNALVIIAVFIIVIACLNFINLSTAMSVRRAKEVGVRKTIGAAKGQLAIQFIGETILLALISTVLASALTILLLPWLNRFTGKDISFFALGLPATISIFFFLALSVGILAGLYPSLVLSRFEPIKVLKASIFAGGSPGRTPWLRHGLVIIQFSLSILLITSAIIVFRQVNFLHNKDLGFNKEQIMFFPMRGDNLFKYQEAFKSELLQSPGVTSVSIGYGYPGDAVAGDQIIVLRNGQMVTQNATQLTVDFDYIKTLQLQLVAGRDFSRQMGTDKDHAWIINETAVKELGFGTPQKALGQTLYWHPWDGNNPDSLKVGQVIGVVKDFNYKSLYDKVETTVIQIYPLAAWKVAVKIKTADMAGTISRIRDVWNKFAPDYPIEYKFLDENFNPLYRSEDKLGSLLWIATGIAVFVACLGLFGLAAYTGETRKKEVGIRKILGARTEGVALLLSKDFIRPVLVALLIALPIAWYLMNHWLQGFAYRTEIAWWIFAITGLVSILIAVLTISYQALRAAIINPVKTLRTE